MDKPLVSITEAAARTGLSRRRILQMVENGRMRTVRDKGRLYVSAEDVEVLKREQSFLRPGEVRRRLNVTNRELMRLINKGVVKPRNVISQLALFDPGEIDACVKQVETSRSIEEAAEQLEVSVRQVYRLIHDGKLESIETAHGRRVPFSEINIYIAMRWLGGA